jgi:hypothetical protein
MLQSTSEPIRDHDMTGLAGSAVLDDVLSLERVRGRDHAMAHSRRAVRGRSAAIIGIKLVHSAIFLLNSAAILHVFVAGVGGHPSRWTRPAVAIALSEVVVFTANHGRCPLTDLVEHLGAESGRVSDIFLPRWLADRIPQFCGPLLLAGVLALSWRRCSTDRRHMAGQQ